MINLDINPKLVHQWGNKAKEHKWISVSIDQYGEYYKCENCLIEGFRHKREKSPRWEVIYLLNNDKRLTLIKQNCTEYTKDMIKLIIE